MRITKYLTLLAGLMLLTTAGSAAPDNEPDGSMQVYNVKALGAAGDGVTLETGIIQQAVDRASAAGGGTVYFPPGRYLSGTIELKSMVTLHLEQGAVLLGSTDISHFPKKYPAFRSYTDNYVCQSLIYAENQHDIAITGRGTIDGQGEAFRWEEYRDRPQVIRMVTCKDILIEGVHLRSSPLWMQQYLGCENLRIQGITVYNHSTYNNDMIDIDCCRNVIISDCFGDSDDDGITLKSTSDRPTENVTITNCVISSGCNGIKMGTESNGGFRNITISNCTINSWYGKTGFYGMTRGIAGICLEIVDGGTLENVSISNISIKNVSVALFLRLANRARPFKKDMAIPGIGSFSNVVIDNITASGLEQHGCSITGLPGYPVRGVTLSNIRMVFPGGGTVEDFLRPVGEREAEYPEATMFGNLPAYAFYCRHVEGLRFRDIDISAETREERPAMVFDDVTGLDINGFSERKTQEAGNTTFVLKDVIDAGLAFCRPARGTKKPLTIMGETVNVKTCDGTLDGGSESSAEGDK